MAIYQMQCCGVLEIDGLSGMGTPRATMIWVIKDLLYEDDFDCANGPNCAFILFTSLAKSKYGSNFKAFIVDNKLGTVLESPARWNPNSGNRIKVWIWAVDRERLARWWRKTKEFKTWKAEGTTYGGY